jgi:hypothetical protein
MAAIQNDLSNSLPAVLAMLIVGMLLLGLWPPIWRYLGSKGRCDPLATAVAPPQRRPPAQQVNMDPHTPSPNHSPSRHPFHTFLDYGLTYIVIGTLAAVTLGNAGPSIGSSPKFSEQIHQANGPVAAFAILAGICLGLADLAMLYSIALIGVVLGPMISSTTSIIVGATPAVCQARAVSLLTVRLAWC